MTSEEVGDVPDEGDSAMSLNYDDLSASAERGDLTVKLGTVRRGSEAATEAQRLLMEATGASSAGELNRIALGRRAQRYPSTDLTQP